jgi:FixJ family two-component response regulator
MPVPTVYVLDDDVDVLKATERLLVSAGIQVAAFQSAHAFLSACDEMPQGCLVMDLAMPGMSGIDVQRALAERANALPVIFLTGRGDIRTCAEVMKNGAVDFLTKPVDEAELLAAVSSALARDEVQYRERAARARNARALETLTEREREVLHHVVSGRLNKQIAADLGTTERTIKFHRGNLMRKLGIRTVAELVRIAGHGGAGR